MNGTVRYAEGSRPLLLVVHQEARVVALVAPAEDERVDITLELPADVQEAGALRCTQPFEAVWPQAVGQVRRRWLMRVLLNVP